MDDARLADALDRSERAILRIERAVTDRRQAPAPGPSKADEALRAKVREAVAELDSLIREAAH